MQLNFDANNVEPDQKPKPVPTGWYNVIMTESEEKPTNAGDGSYLNIQLKIVDGDFANRVLFARLNLNSASEKAREIAYKQLSAICHATGQMQIQQSSQLHGLPFQARAVHVPADGEYDEKNDIKGYRGVDDGKSAKPTGGGNPAGKVSNPASMAKNPASASAASADVQDQPTTTAPVQETSTAQSQENTAAQSEAAPTADTEGVPPWKRKKAE